MMIKKVLVAALLASCLAAPASATVRVLETTAALTSDGASFKAGDELPNAEIRLASGTATLAIDGGRFLVTGPARFTPRRSTFKLQLGGLLSVLTKRAGWRFSVRTPSAVAAVRGTDFYVSVGTKQEVDVCICVGALEVSAKGMETLPMKSDSHLNYRFWTAKTETARGKSPMIGHTDADLDVLRGLLAAKP